VTAIHLRSSDGRHQLKIDANLVEKILTFCEAAGEVETGGLLIGRYNPRHDTALVLDVLGPAADSSSGRTWFQRGTMGVQKIVERLWKSRGAYYLGEWHFHPSVSPAPSSTDFNQMLEIATSPSWQCPEPVLLIIGGDPRAAWRPCGLVTTREKRRVALRPA
jgi:integrative and conjugative element protein (TIGR02256 family)